jgi:hypothetical protein
LCFRALLLVSAANINLGLPMPNCTATPISESIELGSVGCLVGGNMTSDGGVMLLSATDHKLELMDPAARCITDPRNPLLIQHTERDMLRQRFYGLALCREDINDHPALRQDVAMQAAACRAR